MELSKEWLAGFFDGEGCISLWRRKNNKDYQLGIDIAQVEGNILMLIASIYGGKVRKSKKNVHQWTLRKKNLQIKFLIDIESFLILKKPQAKMALIYLSTVDRKHNRFCRISDETLKMRNEVYLGLKSEKSKHSTKNRIENLI